jgi:predicted permease
MSDSEVPLGSIIYAAVKPIFKIYFIIAAGFYLGRKSIITIDTARNLSAIVVTLALPSLLFSKIVTNIQSSDIKQIGIIALMSFLLMIFGGLGSYFGYLLNKPKFWKGTAIAVGMLSNISDLPIAYLETFAVGGIAFSDEEGEKGISYICIFTMFQVFFQFNLGLNGLIGWDFNQQIKSTDDAENHQARKLESSTYTATDNDDNDGNTGNDDNDDIYQNDYDGEDSESFADASFLRVASLRPTSSNISRLRSNTSQSSIRRHQSETIHDIINEYSEANAIKRQNSRVRPGEFTELKVIPGDDEKTAKPKSKASKVLLFFYENMTKPLSATVVIAVIIAMIPWVKALFVTSDRKFVHIPNAPDEQPPLSFVMDFATYLGSASVPLGLLILGSTLSRLAIGEMPKRFWVTPLFISLFKLVISPIIGVCLVLGFSKANFFKDDDILKFVCTIVWCLPNATSIIYITAFYNPTENVDDYHQMDYLALTYIMQYPLLVIALPFLTTFTMKVLL